MSDPGINRRLAERTLTMLEKLPRSIRLAAPSAAVMALLAAAPTLQAQDMSMSPADAPAAAQPWEPVWATDEIRTIAEGLSGAWRTTAPIESTGGSESDETHVLMLIHPVPVEGMTDTVYIEAFRTDDLITPFRQAIGQFYTRRGDPRLRTFEVTVPDSNTGSMAHLGAHPEIFPELSADDLIATLDISLYPTSTGFTGRTPYPYPTANGGAVEMTSSLEVNGDRLVTVERGYDADGDIVWGAGEDGKYEFTRIPHPFAVDKRDNGLVVIDVVRPEGDEVADGDQLHVHYGGWLKDTYQFDTSRQEGRDVFRFGYPPRLIQGWNEGLNGVTTGTVRKLVIPGDMGYGPRGQPRANIPPDATLYFTLEILLVEKPSAEEPAPAPSEE